MQRIPNPWRGRIYDFKCSIKGKRQGLTPCPHVPCWRVELFFKWIKQHLRIKAFYDTTENAVKTQTWTAISVYVLVALIRKKVNADKTLYEILQILSVSLLEKIPISQALSDFDYTKLDAESQNQLSLFT